MVRLWWLALGVAVVLSSSDALDVMEAQVTAGGDAILDNPDIPSHAPSPHVVSPPTATGSTPDQAERESSHHAGSANVVSQASLVVLQKELEVLETLVELQVRKLHTLETMRASLVVDNHDESITGVRRHRTQQASRRELEEAVDRKLSAAMARVMAGKSQARFDSYFIERALVSLDEDVVDVKMGKLTSFPTHDLVVIAMRAGGVRVLLSSGEEMLRLDTQLSPLASVQLETASDPPMLVVLSDSSSPELRSFALGIELDDKPIASSDLPVGSSQRAGSIRSIKSIAVPTAIERSLHGAIRAVSFARSSRRTMLSVAHSDGTVGFYALNGTLVHEIETHAKQIATIVTHRNFVAFANSTRVVVFPMSRQREPEYQVCEGSLATVASIAFDPVFPDIVFAGTTDGELLAFVLVGNAETPRHCKLFHRSVVKRGSSLQVAAMKGYVAAASPNELVMFNVTRGDGALTVARACSMELASDVATTPLTGRIAVAENGHATVLSVVTSTTHGQQSLLILQSLLSHADSFRGEPELWRGLMFVGMIVIAALSAQYFFRRQKEPSGRFEDSDKWREIMARHGRDTSVGSATTATSATDAPPRDFSSPKHIDSLDDTYMGDPTMYGATPEMFGKPRSRRKRGADDHDFIDDPELQRKIAEARRETLECSFDDLTDEE